jgi:hypothetical protein
MFDRNYIRYGIIICAVVVMSIKVAAQDLNIKEIKHDTNYVKDLSDKLSLRVYGINKFNKFNIYNESSGHTLQYAPNSDLNLGFGINYKWFGIGFAFNFPFVNNDDDIYGTTNRFDFQLNIFTRNSLVDVYFQSYQGFYVENPESYIDDWEIDQGYPIRSDIRTSTLGASYLYMLKSKKFSARAAFIQTELQKKSAGSFLGGGFFSLFNMSADSSVVPVELKPVYDSVLFFNQISVSSFGLAFGYSHTFVMWKKIYFSITLVPGIAVQRFDVTYKDVINNRQGARGAFRMLSRIALVYNSEKWYTGLTFQDDGFSNSTGKDSNNTLSYDVGVLRFFYGRRFDIQKYFNKKS